MGLTRNYYNDWEAHKQKQNRKRTCVPIGNAMCRQIKQGGAGQNTIKDLDINDNGIPASKLNNYTKSQQFTAACRKRCNDNSCPGSFVRRVQLSNGNLREACFNCRKPDKNTKSEKPNSFLPKNSRFINELVDMQVCSDRGGISSIRASDYATRMRQKPQSSFKIILGLEAKIIEIQNELDYATKWYETKAQIQLDKANRQNSELQSSATALQNQIADLLLAEETLISQLDACNETLKSADEFGMDDGDFDEFDGYVGDDDHDPDKGVETLRPPEGSRYRCGGESKEDHETLVGKGVKPGCASGWKGELVCHDDRWVCADGQYKCDNMAAILEECPSHHIMKCDIEGTKCVPERTKDPIDDIFCGEGTDKTFLGDWFREAAAGQRPKCRSPAGPRCVEQPGSGKKRWSCPDNAYDCSQIHTTLKQCNGGAKNVCTERGYSCPKILPLTSEPEEGDDEEGKITATKPSELAAPAPPPW